MNNEGVLALLELPEIIDTMTVHGNGFLKIEFSDVLQLHVWHDALPKQVVPTVVHDHNFCIDSAILAGTLINTIVEPIYMPDGDGHYHRALGGPVLERIDPLYDGNYRLRVGSSNTYRPGDRYQMVAGQFHMANTVDTTITVMHKIPPFTEDPTIVMIHKDIEPDNSFDREAVPIPPCILEDIREILSR